MLGVLDEDDKESSEEDKDDKEKGKRTRDRVLQFAVRTQNHHLWNYLQKPKELGIQHMAA
eukprot:14840616-Ditylum_brightwellii.AAC.1